MLANALGKIDHGHESAFDGAVVSRDVRDFDTYVERSQCFINSFLEFCGHACRCLLLRSCYNSLCSSHAGAWMLRDVASNDRQDRRSQGGFTPYLLHI